MKIACAQINLTVGDFAANCAKILDCWQRAPHSDLLLTPELSISGYSPEDMILNGDFVSQSMRAAEQLAVKITRGAVIAGSPWRHSEKIYNAALLMRDGKIAEVQFKYELPNFGVFDEPRIFTQGELPKPMMIAGVPVGILICRDLWHERVDRALYQAGAKILLSPNASPFDLEKDITRKGEVKERYAETKLPIVYLNTVGGQDEVVFDGASFAVDGAGKIIGQAPRCAEHLFHIDFDPSSGVLKTDLPPADNDYDTDAELYQAMCLGTRDYVRKNGFSQVLLGLSGGVDSALVAVIAADALGANNVRAVMLPSPYTSAHSTEDAIGLARNLGIKIDEINIADMMRVVESSVGSVEKLSGLSLENMQSRLRGLALMAISNQTGALLLTTGNKSENAAGYATLYGDMCGAYNPIKDLYKTQVYSVCEWRNSPLAIACGFNGQSPIPGRILTKAPTAELRAGQKDQDTLPPYDLLDKILYKLIEQNQSIAEIVAHGFDAGTVLQIAQMLDKSEYKRRQAAPGPKLSIKAFGKDRRMPITQNWKRT